MQDFWFYVKLGLNHVLDFSAYDHMLFLAALAIPFTFKNWKQVVILTTVFTAAHCLSLTLSIYGIIAMDVALIEFLIPVTITMTAIFNLVYIRTRKEFQGLQLHILATACFGLIHGFGFSNYFKMLMAEEADKLPPLLGFAIGIEVSQVFIVLAILTVSYVASFLLTFKHAYFVGSISILIFLFTIPMLIRTFPL